MKPSLWILTLLLAVSAIVPSASAQCLASAYTDLTDVQPPDTVGQDLNEYAVFFHDLRQNGCYNDKLRSDFAARLNDQLKEGGFRGFLHGGAASFAYATGILLGVQGKLTAEIDDLLYAMPYDPSINRNCGFDGFRDGLPTWTFGDGCMDDFAIAAEGFAWRAAYFQKTGKTVTERRDRAEAERRQSIRYINESLLNTSKSICVYDKRKGANGPSGPCNSTVAEYRASVAANDGHVELFPLNHTLESANYGIGLLASIAHAYAGLQVMGKPAGSQPGDYDNEADVLAVYRALFLHGQRSAGSNPSAKEDEDPTAWSMQCYRPATGDKLTPDDFLHRNRSCQDTDPRYRITLYPVAAFYDAHDFPKGDPTHPIQFTGGQFPLELFDLDGDDGAFRGMARHEIYFTMGHQWWVDETLRKRFADFNFDPATACRMPDASIEGPQRIEARGTAELSVREPRPGATYAWRIKDPSGTIPEIEGPTDTERIILRAACRPAHTSFISVEVKVTVPCEEDGTSLSETREYAIDVQSPSATVTGGGSTPAGDEILVPVHLTGVGPWWLEWNDNVFEFVERPASDARPYIHHRREFPLQNVTYFLKSVRGSGTTIDTYCPGIVLGEAVYTVTPSTPRSLIFIDEKIVANGVPATFTARLAVAQGGPVAGEELSFTILGKNAGTAITDDEGRASVTWTVVAPPGVYTDAIRVTYAGREGLRGSSFARALTVRCEEPTLSPAGLNVGGAQNDYVVRVTTPADCPWDALTATDSGWIHPSPASGKGPGVVTLTVDALQGSSRTGNVFIGGKRLEVRQSGVCEFRFVPEVAYLPASGGLSGIDVIATSGCAWYVEGNAGWIDLIDEATNNFTSIVRGNGSGRVRFRATRNEEANAKRFGQLLLHEQSSNERRHTANINQSAPPPETAPVLVRGIEGGAVRNGQNVTMRLLYSGGPATIRWYADGQLFREGTDEGLANLTLGPGGHYPSAGNSITYRVTVSNSKGHIEDSATWSFAGRTCQVPILQDSTLHGNAWPSDQNSPSSTANVTLRIVAFHGNNPDRTGTLTYQWYRGVAGDRGSEIGGGTTDEISVSPNQTAYYWVEVTDPNCGANQSRTAQITVTGPPPQRRRRAVGHDFSGDSRNDIPWHNVVTGQTEIWAMDGINRTQTLTVGTAAAGQQLQSTGDLNGDDRPDLVWRNPQTGKNDVWLMNRWNVGWLDQLESRADGNWSIGAVADFDDDNYHDVVWHNNATGANEIWFQTDTTHEGTWALPSSPAGWSLHGTGHFNTGDSPDLFFYNRNTGQSSVWLMNDAERVSVTSDSAAATKRRTLKVQAYSLPQMSDPNNVPMLVADLDNNGRADIIWRNTVTGDNSVWIMNGTTVQETRTLESRPDPNWQIGGGGPVNNGGGDSRTATSLSVTADPAAYGGATAISATLTANGAGLANRTLVFTLNGSEIARLLTAADGTAVAGASVAGIAAGLYPNAIAVRFDGNEQYTPSQDAADLVVERPLPAVTWNDPAPITYGTALSAAQLNATATVPGSFAYSPAAGAILDAGYNALDVTFTPADPTFGPVTKSVVLLVNPAAVTITWPAPAPIAYGTPLSQAQLRAKADVPGTFTYTPPSGTVLGIGTHTLQATFVPASEGNYTTTPASVTLTVIQGTQAVSWLAPSAITYGTPLSAAQLNATVTTSGIAPAGALTYSPAAGTILPAGTHTLTVTAAATSFYAAATKSVQLTVNRATPVISWSAPAAIVYGTPLSAAQLNATASVPGSFTYSPAAGTVLNAGTHTLSAQFTPADAANYNGASRSVQLTVIKATPTLSWSAPAAIVYGTALSATQLNAAASVPGSFTYSPAAGTILNAGTHTLSAQFTPADPANYEPASTSTPLSVARAPQTLSWAPPAPIVYGTPLSAAQLNATVSVVGPAPAGALTYDPAAGTVLQAGPAQTLTVSAAATPNYEPATLSVSIDVLKARPVLTWATPAPIVYRTALSAAQLNATANVPGSFTYSPASGTVLEAGMQPLAAHFTPTDTRNYEEADAGVTLEVQQATPVITWAQPAGIVYGTALSATQLDATADVPGAFTYTPPAGTILDAGDGQTLSVGFVPSDTRNFKNVSASVTIDVARAPQTLSWATPAPIVYGTPLTSAQLNAQVSVVGPAAAGALVYSPAAGTVLDAGSRTLTVTALETANYLSATASVSLEVNRAPLSLVVDAKSKLYGAPVPPLTGTLTGVQNNDPISPSYSTTGTMQSNTGTYPIAATLLDPANRLINYDVTVVPSTLTVLPAPLQIAANPATSQYSDPLAQLGATFTGFVLGETPNNLGGTLLVTTTATPLSAPGTYPISIGGHTSSNYAIVYVPSTYTVTQEDARVTITSPLFVTAPASKPATITLSATVKDISATADAAGDVHAGDIRKATLTFVDRATGAALCTAPIGLFSAGDARIGVATCTVTGTFPQSLTVGADVAGYYVRNAAADDATVTISAPTADSVTGSGNITVAGSPAKLNLNLKYDKNGVAKGNFTVAFQRTVDGVVRKYELSATTVDSLAIRRGTTGGTAIITGTAVLRDVTATTAVVLDAAAPLIATATDNGEPAAADTVSIALLRKEGGFWLSVDWNGERTVPQAVQGGNVQIHQAK